MSIALRFCPNACSLEAGRYPRSLCAGGAGGAWVTGAFSGRVTAICTDVVVPTNTGSVLRGSFDAVPVPAPTGSGAEVWYSV